MKPKSIGNPNLDGESRNEVLIWSNQTWRMIEAPHREKKEVYRRRWKKKRWDAMKRRREKRVALPPLSSSWKRRRFGFFDLGIFAPWRGERKRRRNEVRTKEKGKIDWLVTKNTRLELDLRKIGRSWRFGGDQKSQKLQSVRGSFGYYSTWVSVEPGRACSRTPPRG